MYPPSEEAVEGSGGRLCSLVELKEAEADAALRGLLEGIAGGEETRGEELKGSLLEGGVTEPLVFVFRDIPADQVLMTASLENMGIIGEGERVLLEKTGGGRCKLPSPRRRGTGNEKPGLSSFGVGTIIHSSAEDAVLGRWTCNFRFG